MSDYLWIDRTSTWSEGADGRGGGHAAAICTRDTERAIDNNRSLNWRGVAFLSRLPIRSNTPGSAPANGVHGILGRYSAP